MGVVWGGGGNIFLAFYAKPTFLEKINYGNKLLNLLAGDLGRPSCLVILYFMKIFMV